MSISLQDGTYAAKCACGRETKPCNTMEQLYATWYCMVPMSSACHDVEVQMGSIIREIMCHDEFVSSKDLTSIGNDEQAARRALAILSSTGLIEVKYFIEKGGTRTEVSFEEALNHKSGGGGVSAMCRKRFMIDARGAQ